MIYAVEPCYDPELIRPIITHPRVWPWVHEDGDTEWEPNFDKYLHLLCRADGKPVGLVQYEAVADGAVEGHYCFLPAFWGRTAFNLARMALAWAYVELRARMIIGLQPECNAMGLRFTRSLGFKAVSDLPNSWRHRGHLCNRTVFVLNLGAKNG